MCKLSEKISNILFTLANKMTDAKVYVGIKSPDTKTSDSKSCTDKDLSGMLKPYDKLIEFYNESKRLDYYIRKNINLPYFNLEDDLNEGDGEAKIHKPLNSKEGYIEWTPESSPEINILDTSLQVLNVKIRFIDDLPSELLLQLGGQNSWINCNLHYKDCQLNGEELIETTTQEYDEDGNLEETKEIESKTWLNGVLNGEYTFTKYSSINNENTNEIQKIVGTYYNGYKYGIWKYYKEGIIDDTEYYINDGEDVSKEEYEKYLADITQQVRQIDQLNPVENIKGAIISGYL